jgi:hypothetical protein
MRHIKLGITTAKLFVKQGGPVTSIEPFTELWAVLRRHRLLRYRVGDI